MADYITIVHQFFFHPDRIPLAMAAILLVGIGGMVTGPLAGNANSFLWAMVDKTLGAIGGRLDRVQRKAGDLMMRGMMLTAAGLVLFYSLGQGAEQAARLEPLGGATEIILLALCMSAGSVWFALLRLFFALKDKKKISKNAYFTISRTTRTDLTSADDFTITRVGMGLAARSFDKGIVAPVIWYLIGGLPVVFIYAGLSALAWRFGKDGFTKGFGRVPLALEQLMGFVPSVFAGFMMAAAGLLTPTGGMTRAFAALLKPDGRTPYAEGGLPVTAMANALDVGLNGPCTDIDGSAIKRAWAGPDKATAMLDAGHLRRGLYISLMAHLLFLAGLGSALLFS